MSLYAIGDLHLSFSTEKPMDVFGGKWDNYVEKLVEGFSILNNEDLCVICGDVSWSMNLEEALEDFKFIDSLPGRKIILKGNHDYWWNTVTKIYNFFRDNGISTIDILHNNCWFYGDTAICGTRGWFFEENMQDPHDRKILNRELIRLEASLKAAGDRAKRCFFHYPPRYRDYVCHEIIDLMKQYDVKSCHFGHIHGPGHHFAVEGIIEGIEYSLVSADYIDFKPVKVIE
jgi:predicted phosphohydrolase